MIFVDIKKLVYLFFAFLAAMGIFVFFKTYGLSMLFLLVIGLLALKYAPKLVIPVLLLAVGVHFTGGFSFVADILEFLIVAGIGIPFCLMVYICGSDLVEEWKRKKLYRIICQSEKRTNFSVSSFLVVLFLVFY